MRGLNGGIVSRRQKGIALVIVVVALSLVVLSLLVALTFATFSGDIVQRQLLWQGDVINVANAGLTEALDWFRRQPQPVTTFNPTNSGSVNDTDTNTTPPSIVRSFELSKLGRVWARYEAVQGTGAINGSGVVDASVSRGKTAGSVWRLESNGTIYVNNDPAVAYNASPNVILARKTLRTEIQKFAIATPADCALCIYTCSNANVGTASAPKGRVQGGAGAALPGVACSAAVPGPNVAAGSPGGDLDNWSGGVPTTNWSISAVFGLSQTELYQIADINVNAVSQLPATLPQMQVIVIDVGAGTATFNAANPLVGSGILFVNGNLSISGTSSWSGVIYVNSGNYTQIAPAFVDGTVIVPGSGSTGTVQGTGDYAELVFDKFILGQVSQQIGQFKAARTPWVP
jgi:hypothetical protein